MSPDVTPEILAAIETVLRQTPAGMTLNEVSNAFDPPAQAADMQVWLLALIDQERVELVEERGGVRYRVAVPDGAATGTPDSPGADAEGVVAGSADPGSGGAGADRPGFPSPTVSLSAADEARYAALFDLCVFPMVTGLMPRVSVTSYLQTQGRKFLETPGERLAFLEYGLRRMDALNGDDAAAYGLTSEQVAAWQQAYAPPVRRDEISDGRQGNASPTQPTSRPQSVTVNQRMRPGFARAGVPTGARAIATTADRAGPKDLQTEIRATAQGMAVDMAQEIAMTWDLRGAMRRTGAAMRATLSPGRVALAVVWACAVYWGVQYYLRTAAAHATPATAQRAALTGQMLAYATVPLCGVVWLGFRWWDLRERDGLTVVDVVVTLLLGGVFGLLLANVVLSLASCMSGLLPH